MQETDFLLFLFFARCIHALCPIIQKGVWIDGISELVLRPSGGGAAVHSGDAPRVCSFRRSGGEAVRALIACLAETPEEGRALFGVLVQQKTLEAASRGGGASRPEALPPAEEILEQMPCKYERRVRMKDKTALTARQKRFVEEYLACGDGPEAAIAAGYSPATAEERAGELLRDPAVQRCRRESKAAAF